MVAGDLVNTASRVQAAAEPGTVLVGDATHRATEAAIAYDRRGRARAQGQGRAGAPLAGAPGRRRSGGGEGRRRGSRRRSSAATASSASSRISSTPAPTSGRARLVSVVGVAGIGKSRLSWEFEKYIDGLADDVWWHRGRCLSYGDGVAYWALAEMVRARAKILEDEAADVATAQAPRGARGARPRRRASARGSSRACSTCSVSAERIAPDREDLFSAWRRFFERLAEQGPARAGVRGPPLGRRGTRRRSSSTSSSGAPPPDLRADAARPGARRPAPRVPGLDAQRDDAAARAALCRGDGRAAARSRARPAGRRSRDRLRDAADGIPLYAVETVRMLLDRGAARSRRKASYARHRRPRRARGAGDAPRADRLATRRRSSRGERRLLQDAACSARRSRRADSQRSRGSPRTRSTRLVAALVRKELLAVDTDPFSPERGQLRLPAGARAAGHLRDDRAARPPGAAPRRRPLPRRRRGLDPDEIAEVIAAHYLDAHEADPPPTTRRGAGRGTKLVHARCRARGVARLAHEAQRAFERRRGARGRRRAAWSLARARRAARASPRVDRRWLLAEARPPARGDRDPRRRPARTRGRGAASPLGALGQIEEAVVALERRASPCSRPTGATPTIARLGASSAVSTLPGNDRCGAAARRARARARRAPRACRASSSRR